MKFVKALTWTFPLHKLVWRELDSKKAKFAFGYLTAILMYHSVKQGIEMFEKFDEKQHNDLQGLLNADMKRFHNLKTFTNQS